MDVSTKIIADFDSQFQAEIILGLLESKGIKVVIFNNRTFGSASLVSTRTDTMPYITVCDEDYERALDLVDGTSK